MAKVNIPIVSGNKFSLEIDGCIVFGAKHDSGIWTPKRWDTFSSHTIISFCSKQLLAEASFSKINGIDCSNSILNLGYRKRLPTIPSQIILNTKEFRKDEMVTSSSSLNEICSS